MCTFQERRANADYEFNLNTKCCSFHPSIPNFLVGAIICDNDQDPEAKAQFVRGALTNEITPFGIDPSYATRLYYRLKPFGKFVQANCPFYMNHRVGSCAIYNHRNAVCSTWFCKHERGGVGWRFWQKLDEMLTVAEIELSKHCIAKLQIKIPEEPKDVRERFWGNWMFREPEFFQECWKIVERLTWGEVLSIGGERLSKAVNELIEASHHVNSATIPMFLRMGEFTQEDVGDDIVRVWAYNKYNPIDLRKEIVDVLPFFDGRSIEEVLAQIGNETSVHLDERLLLQLTDYKILIST
jgi:hypothetical protein